MFRKILGAAAIMLAVHGGALAQTLNEGEVLGNFSPTPGPAVPTDLTGPAGFGLFGNGVGTAPSYQGYLGYSGLTPRSWQSKAGDSVNIMDYAAQYNCIQGDYTTDCTAAFNAAVLAVSNYSQSADPVLAASTGTVHVPAGPCFRITAPITMLRGVSLIGEGGLSSCILADDTDALQYSFNAYYDQPQVSNILLYGCHWDPTPPTPHCAAPTAARTAILRTSGTNAEVDNMYGLALQNLMVWGFDTAVDVATVRNMSITNSYFQNINTCVTVRGFSFGVRLQDLKCIRADGDGLGAIGDGFVAITFNYTTSTPPTPPAGITGPEGIEINHSEFAQFNNGIRLDKTVFATITNSDVLAFVNGIRYTNVTGGLFIHNNYIEITGASANVGIFGQGSGGAGSAITNIDSNSLIASGTPTNPLSAAATGIQINESGLWGQHNVNITKNLMQGFTSRDIYVFGPDQVTIDGNYARSSTTANSIEITSSTGGINFITRNDAANPIVVIAADLTSGVVRKCDNIVAGVNESCSWGVTINDTQTLSNKTFVAPALGSPSSVGTMPGFALGGTVSGGGNQINNVVIGAVTPLAITGTTVSANTSITSPIHAASAALQFQSNGSTYAGQITTGQQWVIGANAAPASGPLLTLNQNTVAPPAISNQPSLHLVGANNTLSGILTDAFGSSSQNVWGRESPSVLLPRGRRSARRPSSEPWATRHLTTSEPIARWSPWTPPRWEPSRRRTGAGGTASEPAPPRRGCRSASASRRVFASVAPPTPGRDASASTTRRS